MKVMIIGSTHAGTAAAREILTRHPETAVTIYERNDNVSFVSSGIYLYLTGVIQHLEDMFYTSPADLKQLGAQVKTRHNVLRIDTGHKTVQVANMQTGEVFDDTYDKLIMATGSSVIVPPIMGIDHEKVLLCKNYEQAEQLYQSLQANQRVAIVGAGYMGTELAESYASMNQQVMLFHSHSHILNNYLGPQMADAATKLLQHHQVDIHLNERVTGFASGSNDQLIVETAQGDYEVDLAVVCAGFMPNTELLRGQVAMDRHGAILINDYVQTSDPDIYAAGDACVVNYNPTGQPAYTPLATNALRQGALAGINVFGDLQPYMGTQATSAMQLFDHTMATTGLTYLAAQRRELPVRHAVYQGNWRPAYMPTTAKVTIELVYNYQNRQLLGAQFWSRHDIAQAANTISVMIQNQNTIDDLAYVDMFFQPNFNQPFNYLNLVGQLAVKQEYQRGNQTPRITDRGNWSNSSDKH
ncbi:Pyridine nucleotide-disulfide oxidoreductase [Lactiplantibacillus plantarum]|uniref:FAD-dependent oxidoreductase n=1 Tax=Lactiplantibacillus plantarum TaxID=1590 RepID=UPI0004DD1C22|nr:FAD-dependent oxidoreductase [Lactiplantibacillus plantarum]KEZ14127.1 Pyridine nucleotide-disulfide oxidoreductase [Lactiplantibacillus plantarum]